MGRLQSVKESGSLKTQLTQSQGELDKYRNLEEKQRRAFKELEDRFVKSTLALRFEILERKQVERALKESEARLVDAQEVAHIGSWHLDLEKNNLIWTDENYRIFGKEIGTVMNYEGFYEIVHPDDRDYVDKKWVAAMQGDSYDIEHRLLIDGKVKWVREKAKMHFDADGKPVSGIGITQDITELKNAELEKERLRDQLMQAQKMEAIGTLAGGIAHDFNNILTVIINYAAIAQMDFKDDPRLERCLKPMSVAARKGADLVQQLLIFSKHKSMQRTVLNLSDIIEHISKMLSALSSEDIIIEKDLAGNLYNIEADSVRIEQVLTNLVVNAIGAMPGGGKITLRTKNITFIEEDMPAVADERLGSFVSLTVKDTGMGMDAETKEHVFEPFFTTKGAGGTGLGLAVVYGIVQDLKGWIELESEVGVGTTFRIYLPVSNKLISDKTDREQLPKKIIIDKFSRRLLLVEDEELVRRSTKLILMEHGYEVVEAGSVDDAINIFDAEDDLFDLVLTDVIMPNKSGLDLFDELSKKSPSTPVLFMSGYLDDKVNVEDINSKGCVCVQKPYEVDNLLLAIDEAIGGKEKILS